MPARSTTAELRLVGTGAPLGRAVIARPVARVRAEGTPIRARADRPMIASTDARWVLAVRTRESLEGGAAAVLGPERRAELQRFGHRLGLRPFDISLVIAIVQDHARCPTESPSSLVERLSLVPGGSAEVACSARTRARVWWAAWVGATIVLAAVLTAAGVAWLGQ